MEINFKAKLRKHINRKISENQSIMGNNDCDKGRAASNRNDALEDLLEWLNKTENNNLNEQDKH